MVIAPVKPAPQLLDTEYTQLAPLFSELDELLELEELGLLEDELLELEELELLEDELLELEELELLEDELLELEELDINSQEPKFDQVPSLPGTLLVYQLA